MLTYLYSILAVVSKGLYSTVPQEPAGKKNRVVSLRIAIVYQSSKMAQPPTLFLLTATTKPTQPEGRMKQE